MNLEYPYTLEPQPDGSYLVQFLDLAEAFTEGSTIEEAAFHAVEVLSLVLEQRIDDNTVVPRPTPAKSVYLAAPRANIQTAVLLRWAREDEGKTVSDLARAMNTSWPAAQRLERTNGNPTLKQLERAAAALGKRLIVHLA